MNACVKGRIAEEEPLHTPHDHLVMLPSVFSFVEKFSDQVTMKLNDEYTLIIKDLRQIGRGRVKKAISSVHKWLW